MIRSYARTMMGIIIIVHNYTICFITDNTSSLLLHCSIYIVLLDLFSYQNTNMYNFFSILCWFVTNNVKRENHCCYLFNCFRSQFVLPDLITTDIYITKSNIITSTRNNLWIYHGNELAAPILFFNLILEENIVS